MADDISAKNTKNEILEAYHDALEQLKVAKKTSKQELKAVEEKKEIVSKASNHSSDDIVQNIAKLKLSLVRSLEDIEEQLLTSYKQLASLQQAIEIQSKELTDLYEIKTNTDSLAALLHAQKEKSAFFDAEMKNKSANFEQEMTQKRVIWKKEQDEFELSRKEYEQQTKKSRQREEDEYSYQRDLVRKKEQDQYSLEKELLEKELSTKRTRLEQEFATREANIVNQEQEFNTLKQKAEKFPEELQKAIQDTTETVTERLTFKFDYETKLAQKEVEGERKLSYQMITALEAKIAQLESQAKHLSDKSNQANLQVQDIAVKAIESASLQRFIPSYSEKPVEQVK
jgi:colicin import membrane protein